jgi:hypothetical protein
MKKATLLTLLTLALVIPLQAQQRDQRDRHQSYISYDDGGTIIRSGEDGKEVEGRRNLPVFPGDEIVTARRGRAEVHLSDGNILGIDRATALRFRSILDSYEGDADETVVELRYGKVATSGSTPTTRATSRRAKRSTRSRPTPVDAIASSSSTAPSKSARRTAPPACARVKRDRSTIAASTISSAISVMPPTTSSAGSSIAPKSPAATRAATWIAGSRITTTISMTTAAGSS